MMSTKGAKRSFTEEEKLRFKPIFVKYIQKKYVSKDILAALDGDKKQFAQFKRYADELIAFMQQRETQCKIDKLEQSKALLTKSIERRENLIDRSREKLMETVLRMKEPLRV
jgi:hypothetical protein